MNESLNTVRKWLIAYNIMTIALISAMSVKSYYMIWWWKFIRTSNNYPWEPFYYVLIVIDIVFYIMLVFSIKMTVEIFLFPHRVYVKSTLRLLMASLLVYLAFIACILAILWIWFTADYLLEVWMFLLFLNEAIGIVTWNYFDIAKVQEELTYSSV